MVNESFTSKRQEYFTVKKNLVNKRPHLKQDDILFYHESNLIEPFLC